jgi:tetrahydromethanopterin S-methyltransferase subunit B
MGNHARKNESDAIMMKVKEMEERMIALERAFEALLKKEEMSKLNLHGGDGEWY